MASPLFASLDEIISPYCFNQSLSTFEDLLRFFLTDEDADGTVELDPRMFETSGDEGGDGINEGTENDEGETIRLCRRVDGVIVENYRRKN